MRYRCEQLNLRMTPEEKQHLHNAAARCGLTAAGYIRMLLAGYLPKETPPLEYHKLLQALYALQHRLDANDPQAQELFRQTLLMLQQTVTVPERM